MTTAYDYKNQTWVHGAPAVALRIEQLNEELQALEAPDGASYWAFAKQKTDTRTRQAVIEHIKNELANL